MKPRGFLTYVLKCDNCGNTFDSREAFPERLLCPRCMIVFKAGIKEVVDWVENHKFSKRSVEIDGYWYYEFNNDVWQAFLKEV